MTAARRRDAGRGDGPPISSCGEPPVMATAYRRRCRSPFSRPIGYSRSANERNPYEQSRAKLAIAGSFGISLLGLYFIFTSTSTPMSLSANAMFVVGAVVGVILSWSANA